MYNIFKDSAEIGTADTVVHIFYGGNGAYQECEAEDAQGFCVKLPYTYTDDNGNEITDLMDTVFCLPGKKLKGGEPEGEYTVASWGADGIMGAAANE